MFAVKCLGSVNETTKSLDRGVCFGFGDKPIQFEVKSDVIKIPLILRFCLKSDPTLAPVSFVVGRVENENQIDVTFYNVGDGANAGLKIPSEIIKIDRSQLSMHFRVDRAFKAESYSLMYEFFENTLPGNPNE